jgi:hypothetical protein
MILPVISHVKFVIHQFLYAIKHTAYRSTQTISIRETLIFCLGNPDFCIERLKVEGCPGEIRFACHYMEMHSERILPACKAGT